MKIYSSKYFIISIFFILFFSRTQGTPEVSREYQIKGAFLYNFIKFVDWPEEKMANENNPIIVGIIGNDPFGDTFEPLKNKLAKQKRVEIKRFKCFEELEVNSNETKSNPSKSLEDLKKCYMLFISSSEKKDLKKIIKCLKSSCVLTVGDMNGFLEAGGTINFIIIENKVRFEINLAAANGCNIKIRSKLLSLAKRVIKKEAPPDVSMIR